MPIPLRILLPGAFLAVLLLPAPLAGAKENGARDKPAREKVAKEKSGDAEALKQADAFFGLDKLYPIHIRVTREGWELMQPTRRVRPAPVVAESVPGPATRPVGRAEADAPDQFVIDKEAAPSPAAPDTDPNLRTANPADPKPSNGKNGGAKSANGGARSANGGAKSANGGKKLAVEGDRSGASAFGFEFGIARADLEIDGQSVSNVGFRMKGNSSYEAFGRSSYKHPFKLDFNRFVKGRSFRGLKSLNLNNNAFDPTNLRESLSYHVYRSLGVPAPRTALATVYLTIDGVLDHQYLGVYTLIEETDDDTYLDANFGTDKGLVMKPENIRGLPYMGEDFGGYELRYRPKSDVDPRLARRFIEFTRLLNYADDATFRARVHEYFDVDAFLRYLAATVLICNLDSPLITNHNFILHVSPADGRTTIMPWDMNLAFATYGVYGSDGSSLSVSHPWAGDHKLFDRLLAVDAYRDAYHEYLRTGIAKCFNEVAISGVIDRLETALLEGEAANAACLTPLPTDGGRFGRNNARMDLRTYVARRADHVLGQLEGTIAPEACYTPRASPPNMNNRFGVRASPTLGNLTAMSLGIRRLADRSADFRLTPREARDAAAAFFYQFADEAHPDALEARRLAPELDRLVKAYGAYEERRDDRGDRGDRGRGRGGWFGGFRRPAAPAPVPDTAGDHWAKALFADADANRDGRLTLDEVTAAADRLFCLADRDDNGLLDDRELTEALDLLLAPPAPADAVR